MSGDDSLAHVANRLFRQNSTNSRIFIGLASPRNDTSTDSSVSVWRPCLIRLRLFYDSGNRRWVPRRQPWKLKRDSVSCESPCITSPNIRSQIVILRRANLHNLGDVNIRTMNLFDQYLRLPSRSVLSPRQNPNLVRKTCAKNS